MQTIQTKKQDLLNKNGIIENPGFAFTPVWNYNRENIKAPNSLIPTGKPAGLSNNPE